MKHGPELGFDDDGRPVLITAAAQSFEEQHRARVRKYLIMMSCRIPAFVLAAVAYGVWHNGLVSLLILAVSIPLPWMAVLIANDRPPRRADEPRRYAGAPQHGSLFQAAQHRVLEAGPVVDAGHDPDVDDVVDPDGDSDAAAGTESGSR